MCREEVLVRARGLARVHRVGSSEVRAVDGLDLDVRAGELLVLVGVSGSGKSSLLHLLGGLDRPDAGELSVGGRELSTLGAHERALYRRGQVGFVFQAFHLLPALSAAANVELALTLRGVFGRRRTELARAALERVGLGARAAHRPSELSGGEQQRVALARAVVDEPPLLLADEPTGNLDRGTAREVAALLARLRDELGSTVVVVTHDEELFAPLADRVLRLSDGRVVDGEALVG